MWCTGISKRSLGAPANSKDMVRYSVSMDDALTEKIDRACEQKKISRSDWIAEACTSQLSTAGAANPCLHGPARGRTGTEHDRLR